MRVPTVDTLLSHTTTAAPAQVPVAIESVRIHHSVGARVAEVPDPPNVIDRVVNQIHPDATQSVRAATHADHPLRLPRHTAHDPEVEQAFRQFDIGRKNNTSTSIDIKKTCSTSINSLLGPYIFKVIFSVNSNESSRNYGL